MTKKEYLERLRRCLIDLPPEEVDVHLAYYSEMIDDRLEDALLEEEATAAMEEPEKAAEKILQELPLQRLVRRHMERRKKWGWKEILLVILLAPLWLPVFSVVLGMIGGLFGLLIGVIAMIVGVGAVATAFLYTAITNTTTPTHLILSIGSAIMSVGVGLLLLALFFRFTNVLRDLFQRIVGWLKKYIIRRREYNE